MGRPSIDSSELRDMDAKRWNVFKNRVLDEIKYVNTSYYLVSPMAGSAILKPKHKNTLFWLGHEMGLLGLVYDCASINKLHTQYTAAHSVIHIHIPAYRFRVKLSKFKCRTIRAVVDTDGKILIDSHRKSSLFHGNLTEFVSFLKDKVLVRK